MRSQDTISITARGRDYELLLEAAGQARRCLASTLLPALTLNQPHKLPSLLPSSNPYFLVKQPSLRETFTAALSLPPAFL